MYFGNIWEKNEIFKVLIQITVYINFIFQHDNWGMFHLGETISERIFCIDLI